MHYIGIDLAWGERKPTGLAVVDDDGVLVHVSACRTDDEIVGTLAPFVTGTCLAGIDAPLIVHNVTGNRKAEADLNKDFARFDAGAHPVNTSKPEIGDDPRGARLARRLKLDIDPQSAGPRRAIEVYPHPATVVLFQLGRTLKYKNKKGRDLEALRGELLLLIKRIEELAGADPSMRVDGDSWRELVSAAHAAARKSELRVVEDQVDAIVCAYVTLFVTHKPELTTIYGDYDNGYIVTPALPEGQLPTPRNPKQAAIEPVHVIEPTAIQSAVQQYSAALPDIIVAGDHFIDLMTNILDDAGINYLSVTGRIKTASSFAGKAARRDSTGELLYPDPLRDIRDQIGVRVITYVMADVAAVAQLMHDQLIVMDDRDMGRETASQGRFGYASRHLLIAPPEKQEKLGGPMAASIQGRVASVQIRTVLQHAWAEFEHDIRYKGTVPDEHASEFDRRFTLAAGLLELADREFSAIRDRLRVDQGDRPGDGDLADDDPRLDPRELAAFLAGQYPEAGWSRTDHYAWISGLLLELGITSFGELSDVLLPINELDLSAQMEYRYPPGAVRRLDDALLRAFSDRYVGLHGNEHRIPALRARLERMQG